LHLEFVHEMLRWRSERRSAVRPVLAPSLTDEALGIAILTLNNLMVF